MNTPDTEKEIEIEICKALEKQGLDIYAVASTLDIFRKAISSRDTYWKKRVRKNVGVYANKKFIEGEIIDPLELYEAITNEDNLK